LRSGGGCGGIYRGHQIRMHTLGEVARLQTRDGKVAVLVAEDMILILGGAVDPVQTVAFDDVHGLSGIVAFTAQ